MIDSTLVMTQKSGDFEVQKHTFSDHQKKHGFKATNICGPDGEILATTDLSGAISPGIILILHIILS